MVQTIEEAKTNYIKMLKEYKEWSDGANERNKGLNVLEWQGSDYQMIMRRTAEFKAIEKVLDLTKEEVKEICKDVGIIYNE